MKDTPIIFSAPMVRGLLDGSKTTTRRLAWREARIGEKARDGSRLTYEFDENRIGVVTGHFRPSPWQRVQPGDRLWVRENFAYVGTCDPGFLTYQATYPNDLPAGMQNVPKTLKEAGYKWTPCIHMPRKVSRLTLIVTATKVERLQDISEADAIAEGTPWDDRAGNVREAFRLLWQSLHGEASWDANPEVVALTFRVVMSNIDRLAA